MFQHAGFTTALNYPYEGCFVPGRILNGESTCSCIPLMLEFNRRVYLKENGFLDDQMARKIRDIIQTIAAECIVL